MTLIARFSRACRWGAALAVAAWLAAPSAQAARAVDLVPIPFPIELRIEPLPACADSLLHLRVSHPLDSCLCVTDAHADSNGFVVNLTRPPLGHPCAHPCGDFLLPLGRFVAGNFMLHVQLNLTFAADFGGSTTYHYVREVPFFVSGDCGTGSTPLPYVQQVRVGMESPCLSCPPEACPHVPVPVSIEGVLPNHCWSYLGLQVLPLTSAINRPVVLVKVRRACPDTANCAGNGPMSFGGTITLDPQQPGAHQVEVRVLELGCIDSTAMTWSHLYPYTVRDSCPSVPVEPFACVWPFMQPALPLDTQMRICDVSVRPGGRAAVVFAARANGVPLAGIQGVIHTSEFLHVAAVERTGPTLGMHLETHDNPDGTTGFVMWSDGRTHIAPDEWINALRVVFMCDSVVIPAVAFGRVGIRVTAASDSLGNAVPLCPIMTLVVVEARVCIGSPPASCDVNGDGLTNVADLVRMVRCFLVPGGPCTDSLAPAPLPDCNGDGFRGIADILCCARTILGAPVGEGGVPGRLQISFGTPHLNGELLEVPLQVHGATDMSGALLRVRFPSERYELASTLGTSALATSNESWTPLLEPGADDLLVGLIRTAEAASDDAVVMLQFRLRAGASHGGSLQVAEGSVAGPDGSELQLDVSALAATIPANPAPVVDRVELSAPRPNPATGRTTFVVGLPREADVDLAIFDLAGRRVATLWRARMAAGQRELAWEPRGVRSGLYFARLSVDGVARTTRVTLRLAN